MVQQEQQLSQVHQEIEDTGHMSLPSLGVDLSEFDLPIPCDDSIQTCGQSMRKQGKTKVEMEKKVIQKKNKVQQVSMQKTKIEENCEIQMFIFMILLLLMAINMVMDIPFNVMIIIIGVCSIIYSIMYNRAIIVKYLEEEWIVIHRGKSVLVNFLLVTAVAWHCYSLMFTGDSRFEIHDLIKGHPLKNVTFGKYTVSDVGSELHSAQMM